MENKNLTLFDLELNNPGEIIENKVQYFENPTTQRHHSYLKAHNHCVLCGTVLEIKHEVAEDGQIKEEAFCSQCDVRTRAKNFILN